MSAKIFSHLRRYLLHFDHVLRLGRMFERLNDVDVRVLLRVFMGCGLFDVRSVDGNEPFDVGWITGISEKGTLSRERVRSHVVQCAANVEDEEKTN